MFERLVPVLKIFCLAVAVLILYQVGRFAAHRDPLAQLHIPNLLAEAAGPPASSTATNTAKPGGSNAPPTGAPSINAAPPSGSNVTVSTAQATNVTKPVAAPDSAAPQPVLPPSQPPMVVDSAPGPSAPAAAVVAVSTPPPMSEGPVPVSSGPPPMVSPGSGPVPVSGPDGGPPLIRRSRGMMVGASLPSGAMPAGLGGMPPGLGGMPPGIAMMSAMGGLPMGMGGMGGPAAIPPDVPAELRPRLERIIQSEIFGPVPRPMPMALLGIAGRDVMLRTPSGQSGLVRVGEELGGVKVLKIGINRVLVEEKGQKQELTIFGGFGGESLLGKENPK